MGVWEVNFVPFSEKVTFTDKPDHFVLDRRKNDRDFILDQYLCEFFECESSTTVLLFPDRTESDQSGDLE